MAPRDRGMECLLHLRLHSLQPLACPPCHAVHIARHVFQPLHVGQENCSTPTSRVADFRSSRSSTCSSSSRSSSPILDVPREGLVGSDDEEEEGGEGTKDVGEDGRGGWLAFEAPDAPGEGDVAVVDQDGVHAEDDEAELGKVGNGTDEVGVCVGVVDREHGCQVDAGAGGEEARFDRKWEVDAEVFFPGDHFPLGVAEALLGGGDAVKDTPVVQGQGDEQCTG